MLGETDGNVYLWTVLYYDSKGRVTQESHSTHRGGTRRTNTGYDFTGHPTKSRTITQDTLAGDLTELYTYSYDAWGRPLTVTHKLGEVRPVTLHNYSYDGAGRIVWDFRNGDVDLATRYTYNVRNSLTSIKVGGSAQQGTLGETFTEMLYYESPRGGAPLLGVQYAGNVSSMSWMAGSDGVMRSYDFSYDGLSRLTGAAYTDNDNGTGLYTRGYTYDLNGNMTSLTTPSGTTNQSYSGNQFSGTGIDYDFNGNLTDNLGCGLTQVKYNILNLPESCHYSYSVGYHQMVGQESYLYSVNGVKLQTMNPMQIVLPGQPDTRARTDYVGNLVYDRTSLKKILIPGGYVEVSTTSNNYRFFITDHLGNNRLVTDASGTILQTNHYDPYGESLPAGASVDSGNPYKWGNKEYDVFLGSYDFGARYYTPASTAIPRWTTMDPLCEKYYSISPYAYCAGNPVNLVDPDGMIFTDDSLPYVNKYEESIRKKLEEAQRSLLYLENKLIMAIASGNGIDYIQKQIGNAMSVISNMNFALYELNSLKTSEQVYEVGVAPPVENSKYTLFGSTTYDKQRGNVIVNLYLNEESPQYMATIAHELKHCYQFDNGLLGYREVKLNGEMVISYSPALRDYRDEHEAIERGLYWGGVKLNDSFYKNLINANFTVESMISGDYQEYSKKYNTIFRYNGVTYVPWEKK